MPRIWQVAAIIILSGCADTGTDWSKEINEYENKTMKFSETNLECQVIQGEHKTEKFYANIKADTFVRSAYYELGYEPGEQFVQIAEGPINRDIARYAAIRVLGRERPEAAPGDNLSFIVNHMLGFGVDQDRFCMTYSVLHKSAGSTTRNGIADENPNELIWTASCTYSYDPESQLIERERHVRRKANGDTWKPGDDITGTYDSGVTETIEKALCRPSKVKLR